MRTLLVSRTTRLVSFAASMLFVGWPAFAQDATAPPHDHAHMTTQSGWQTTQDGVVFAEFNHQATERGGDEFVAPNWWMGMASRNTSRGQITVTSMFSLDAASVGTAGYRELFQSGEALNGHPIVDRQHPHDLFMQIAAWWRIPLTSSTGLTIAGAPSGEPALGPVSFMHRASALDNPTAPLGHHTFDSTHVSFGVITASVDHGPWTVEGSVFNGREPDDDRWDFDFGALDSVSGRVWFRPAPSWELQVSTGHLTHPEELEAQDVQRTTASATWTARASTMIQSVTVAYGVNDTDRGARQAILVEGARQKGLTTLYGRFEAVQVETALLATGGMPQGVAAQVENPVVALTLGGARDVFRSRGFEGGIGADVTFSRTPDSLVSSYGSAHPVSFHVFFRLRPPAGPIGRMWNMRMAQPMGGQTMTMAGHQ